MPFAMRFIDRTDVQVSLSVDYGIATQIAASWRPEEAIGDNHARQWQLAGQEHL